MKTHTTKWAVAVRDRIERLNQLEATEAFDEARARKHQEMDELMGELEAMGWTMIFDHVRHEWDVTTNKRRKK